MGATNKADMELLRKVVMLVAPAAAVLPFCFTAQLLLLLLEFEVMLFKLELQCFVL